MKRRNTVIFAIAIATLLFVVELAIFHLYLRQWLNLMVDSLFALLLLLQGVRLFPRDFERKAWKEAAVQTRTNRLMTRIVGVAFGTVIIWFDVPYVGWLRLDSDTYYFNFPFGGWLRPDSDTSVFALLLYAVVGCIFIEPRGLILKALKKAKLKAEGEEAQKDREIPEHEEGRTGGPENMTRRRKTIYSAVAVIVLAGVAAGVFMQIRSPTVANPHRIVYSRMSSDPHSHSFLTPIVFTDQGAIDSICNWLRQANRKNRSRLPIDNFGGIITDVILFIGEGDEVISIYEVMGNDLVGFPNGRAYHIRGLDECIDELVADGLDKEMSDKEFRKMEGVPSYLYNE